MMEETSIDKIYNEYSSINNVLTQQKEISLLNNYTNTMRKVLVLSCGSFFESQMTKMLKEYVEAVTNGNNEIISFLEKQAIKQKYHTLFDWGKQDDPSQPSKNVNKFLGLFGDDFKNQVTNAINSDNDVLKSQRAFIELGHVRNILVHSDFANYQYDQKTPEEIFILYKSAIKFIPFIKKQLNNVTNQSTKI